MRNLIQVEGIYKKFHLGTVNRSMLLEDLKRWWERRRNRQLRALSEAEHQHHERLESGNEFWALRDVSFSVPAGQTVGIMGRNGAGKSTLLKILSRTTGPTLGVVRTKGRMSSLLEVGTGFHPELTGRENVFVNGAILGMSKKEVRQKFDEIVEFSEIGDFLDTPVKRYSSGMYVRLAFSVAAHLRSDIMILDEVLAVGDARFQKKCQDKLKAAVAEGRTILFVSHQSAAVRTFCSRVIVLKDGMVDFDGETNAGIDHYMASNRMSAEIGLTNRLHRASGSVRFDKVECYREKTGENTWSVPRGEKIDFRLECVVYSDVVGAGLVVALLSGTNNETVASLKTEVTPSPLRAGARFKIKIQVDISALRAGTYLPYIGIGNADCSVMHDLVDSNVDLPAIIITSETDDRFRREGFLDLPARLDEFSMLESDAAARSSSTGT